MVPPLGMLSTALWTSWITASRISDSAPMSCACGPKCVISSTDAPRLAGSSRHLARVCSTARWTMSFRSTGAKASAGRDRLNSWIRVSASIPERVADSISWRPAANSLDFSREARLSRSCVRPRMPASALLKTCPTPPAMFRRACIFSSTGIRPPRAVS